MAKRGIEDAIAPQSGFGYVLRSKAAAIPAIQCPYDIHGALTGSMEASSPWWFLEEQFSAKTTNGSPHIISDMADSTLLGRANDVLPRLIRCINNNYGMTFGISLHVIPMPLPE
ncbi:hypothetical protein COCCADRAFT_30736 [Bipolaris zeicola 26-R-13]|uniref:Uncharacterized protein n=1 Tax=Cochliobolus carbonum (strain 26-R-13) TaxID=930089 RepID=W6XYV8_COCC2|nr:uncharacterized protein COCCADRAFT_30736 [Bipolaris zeicola 26-R-13]EUC27904.1 hypothetical protein COCCADRAFT_30736 [Bipolaris zeicola 26-R-13]